MIYSNWGPFMHDYVYAMDKLINEKPSNQTDRNNKIQKLFEKTIAKVEIHGDDGFIEAIKGCLHSLCEIKPGRTALRKWLKLSKEKEIPLFIVNGNRTTYLEKIIIISEECFSKGGNYYSTFKKDESSLSVYQKGQVSFKPLYITLGHEIIQMIHDLIKKPDQNESDQRNCLVGMNNKEDQHSICGVNLPIYNIGQQHGLYLGKLDVLCENALLLAARLPARISPYVLQKSEGTKIDIKEDEFENYKNDYYEWLNKNLFEFIK